MLSTANIEKDMKFYNLGDKNFETDFSSIETIFKYTHTIGISCLVYNGGYA